MGPKQSNRLIDIDVYKQVAWERDIAISQLKDLGYSFGEKIRTAEVCIPREAVLKEIDEWISSFNEIGHNESSADVRLVRDSISKILPVQAVSKKEEK